MNISTDKFLWVLPFISFFCGYITMNLFFKNPIVIVPPLVGKQVHEILPIITKHNLNIRLIDQKKDETLPEGIILNQIPKAGSSIKSHQNIFIITSTKPPLNLVDDYIGKSLDNLIQDFSVKNIRYRVFFLPHSYPENKCFAQFPAYNQPYFDNTIIVYISLGNSEKPIIWPNFVGMPRETMISFLSNYPIELHMIDEIKYINDINNTDNTIIEQRPFAGTLITLDKKKPLLTQFRIQ